MRGISLSKYMPLACVDRKDDIIRNMLSHLLTRGPRELHIYRGHQPSDTGFIMGHEFTGTVVKIGSAVKTISIGDKVVAPFTASW
jgi:hypothetical protein